MDPTRNSGVVRRMLDRGLIRREDIDAGLDVESNATAILKRLLERGVITDEQILAAGTEPSGGTTRLPAEVAAFAADPDKHFGTPGANGRPRYVTLEQIGKGGMGMVYRAWDLELNRAVAIKLLQGASPEDLQRFNREAQTAARLHHPGIAAVFELGRHKDQPYIAMQYVDGATLADLADAGPLPTREALEIVRDAALTIDAAHAARIVHRDVKPQNIMIGGGQLRAEDHGPLEARIPRPLRVYVMDFGLARSADGGATISIDGELMGTPAYMAPEQAEGDRERIGPATDVYALGASLYEAVTGRPPFTGENPGRILMKVLDREPEPPRKLNPRLHPDIETMILKAMDKIPERRYASARAFADDLDRFLAGEPIAARPLSRPARMLRSLKRHAGIAAALALAFVAIMIGAVSTIQRNRRDAQAAAAAQKARLDSEAARAESLRRRTRALELLDNASSDLREIERFKREHGVDPQDLRVHENRILGKLNFAYAEDDSTPEIYSWIGRWYELIEDDDKAEANYDAGCTEGPDSPEACFRHAEYLMRRIFASMSLPAWRQTGDGVEFHGLPPDGDLHQAAREHLAALDGLLKKSGGRRLTEAEVHLAHAYTEILLGRPEEGRKILDDILAASPWINEVYRIRAMTYVLQGDLAKAVEDLGATVHTSRENPQIRLSFAHYRRALLRKRVDLGDRPTDELAAAIDDCTEILDLTDDRAAALTLRGGLRADLGRVSPNADSIWALAESDLAEAIADDDRNVEALRERAMLRARRGRVATDDLQQALTLATTDAERALLRTLLAERWLSKSTPKALEESARAVELDSGYDVARCVHGEVLLQSARLDESILEFGEALKITPSFARARAGRGRALHLKGRLADALADYDALADPPLDARAELRIDMGNLETDNPEGHFLAAVADADAALRAEPRSARLHGIRAAAHHAWWLKLERTAGKTTHLEPAADAWERQTELDKDNADAWQNLADARFDLGRWADAVKAYERAVELDPARVAAIAPRLDEARKKSSGH